MSVPTLNDPGPVPARISMTTAAAARSPLGNFVALGSGEILARVVAFLIAAMLTRRVGTEGFGELGFATAVTTYLLFVPMAATQDLAGRAIARDPGDAAAIVASTTRVRLVVGILGALAVTLLAYVIPTSATTKALIALSGLSVIPQALNAGWANKALERTSAVSAGLVAVQVVTAIGVYLFIGSVADIRRLPLLQAGGEVAAATIVSALLVRGWRSGSFRRGITLLRGADAILLNRMLRAVIVTADVVLLGLLLDNAQVGLYSAAYRVCFLLTAIAASAHVVFQPAILRAHDDPTSATRILTDALSMASSVGFPLVLGGIFVAPDLLALLFGEPFRAASHAFQLLLASVGLLFLHGPLQTAFLARHRLDVQTRIFGAAAALNLMLNAFLIAPLGIVGSALATVAAELLILACCLVVLWRWHWRPRLRVLIRPAVASLVMCVVLVLLPTTWHVLLRIVISGTIYATVLVMQGGLPEPLRVLLPHTWARRAP